jgi:hypothetical protein
LSGAGAADGDADSDQQRLARHHRELPRMEITAYDPPRRVSWKAISSAGWVIGRSGSYTLEADGEGRTRMVFSITMEPITFAGRLVAPLMAPMGPNLVRPLLKQLKQALEQQRSAAPSPAR